MKIVFVNAFEYDYIGTRLLAAYLQKYGYETHNVLLSYHRYDVVDKLSDDFVSYHYCINGRMLEHRGKTDPLSDGDLAALEEVIREESPNIVGFSARSTNNFLIPILLPIFKRAANKALLVAGGFGPTLEPELYIKGGFDVVVRGEGEEALLEITRCYENHDTDRMVKIANTIWSEKYGGKVNLLRDQERNLSLYCAPLSGHKYFSYINDGKLIRNEDPTLISGVYATHLGRGCVGHCTYCSAGQWASLYISQGKKAYKRRIRCVEDVIGELSNLPKSTKFIHFCDEYIALPTSMLSEFFTKYKNSINLPFFAYFQYNQLADDPNLFKLAVDAGFASSGIGFQSGNYDFVEKYYHRKQNYDVMIKYAHLLFHNFISFESQFISGNCYETLDVLKDTLSLIRKLPYSLEFPFLNKLMITQLKVHPRSPIETLFPRVVTNPMSIKEWHFRAILHYLALVTSESELDIIMNSQEAHDNPFILNAYFHKKRRKMQALHYKKLIEEKASEDWVFYGTDKLYQKNKDIFAPLKPEAIVSQQEKLAMIDSIHVSTCDEFFSLVKNYPINILILEDNPVPIARNLMRSYNVQFENIHACCIDLHKKF